MRNNIFKKDFELTKCDGVNMRIDWPNTARKDSSYESWKKMKTLRNLVQHEYNDAHKKFLELLEFMMIIDPNDRPTAKACLDHPFFQIEILDSDQ